MGSVPIVDADAADSGEVGLGPAVLPEPRTPGHTRPAAGGRPPADAHPPDVPSESPAGPAGPAGSGTAARQGPVGISQRAVSAGRTLARENARTILMVGVGIAVALGAVLRFATPSHLWLDESLTVAIASRPVPGLLHALRHDGSPPLYYLLLHMWISVFGDGDVAVRALSGVLSLLTLPMAWLAGRRVGRFASSAGNAGPNAPTWVATATLLLFACSPYAIRYGSETRMYSLVVLLVLVFGFTAVRALERSAWPRLALLTLTTTALVYTHYWTFLLIFTVAAFLLLQARRRPYYRRVTLRAFAAMAASAVPFAPWMPSFAFQMLHTGTPWAPKVQAQVLLDTVFDWAGPQSTGALLGVVLLGGALIGLTARPAGGRELAVQVTGRVPGRYLAAIWLLPLVLAYFVNMFGGSAYAERYTGIALPACLLLAALGIAVLPGTRVRAIVLALAVFSGLVGGWQLARTERTQAGEIAGQILALARPGDVVAYCPDQLGPAVHRALVRHGPLTVREIVYADASGPALVDWVDYPDRMRRANGTTFAAEVNRLAGPDHAVLLVRADGYRFLEGACAVVSDQLATMRDRQIQVYQRDLYEGASLERFSTLR
ncbi:glycosyltransferase family 39 protein [Frankia sp. AiPa1]|uniref:glycosyltransferase family 39 protein n=1 Tax=Frankia sp. AiPa1 TaxID=573492 RepID=UPI00202B52A6|nr:glycosyltransferase family 39 protein [Frankia sp. AiPa1]MCL9758986.1 glycosyltransferase family 39 protein [Frankia sp. AiPa1]